MRAVRTTTWIAVAALAAGCSRAEASARSPAREAVESGISGWVTDASGVGGWTETTSAPGGSVTWEFGDNLGGVKPDAREALRAGIESRITAAIAAHGTVGSNAHGRDSAVYDYESDGAKGGVGVFVAGDADGATRVFVMLHEAR